MDLLGVEALAVSIFVTLAIAQAILWMRRPQFILQSTALGKAALRAVPWRPRGATAASSYGRATAREPLVAVFSATALILASCSGLASSVSGHVVEKVQLLQQRWFILPPEK